MTRWQGDYIMGPDHLLINWSPCFVWLWWSNKRGRQCLPFIKLWWLEPTILEQHNRNNISPVARERPGPVRRGLRGVLRPSGRCGEARPGLLHLSVRPRSLTSPHLSLPSPRDKTSLLSPRSSSFVFHPWVKWGGVRCEDENLLQ